MSGKVVGRGGVVASGHPAVSAAGLEILRAGGNAVDAAVAAFFTSFIAEPLLSSPLGGGFMVAHVGGEPLAWDFFAAAPGLGSGDAPYRPPPGAFWAEEIDFGSARQLFHIGPGSVAVPGALAGLCTAQRQAGRLTLAEVLAPALRASHTGLPVHGMGAFAMRLLEPIVRATPQFERFFVDDEGALLNEGDLLRNPELGRFYAELAAAGSEALVHDGPLTDLLVDTVHGAGGGLTRQDLVRYEVRRSRPVEVPVARGRLLLTPPPSSGGMLIAYGAEILGALPVPPPGTRAEVLLLRAVMAQTLHARAEVIGGVTPTAEHAALLLDPLYIDDGAARVRRLLELGAEQLPDEPRHPLGSTTHVSVIDEHANACAVTVSNGEGSALVVPGYGLYVNNFLGEQDINPEGFHRYPPGHRLGSSMAPMIALGDSGSVLALGSGGSNRIRTALLQVVRNLLTHDDHAWDAVHADRVHYEDGTLYAEATNRFKGVVEPLADEPMRVALFREQNMFFGGVHLAARRADGTVVGVGDGRRSGAAAVTDPGPGLRS